jgi:hypothetical protein
MEGGSDPFTFAPQMIVMPANSTGWFFHSLAIITQRVGHLYSPGANRENPWPWFPYALDNGAFSCWNDKTNEFDTEKWEQTQRKWVGLLFWAQSHKQKPMWSIVPDRPGDAEETFRKWSEFAGVVEKSGFPLALAVQDGMTAALVRRLNPAPEIICVGGSTDWKWETAEMWAREFKRCHLLRCNSPSRLEDLKAWGYESCDGTGWNRGDSKQTRGFEEFVRGWEHRTSMPLWPHVCKAERNKLQMSF